MLPEIPVIPQICCFQPWCFASKIILSNNIFPPPNVFIHFQAFKSWLPVFVFFLHCEKPHRAIQFFYCWPAHHCNSDSFSCIPIRPVLLFSARGSYSNDYQSMKSWGLCTFRNCLKRSSIKYVLPLSKVTAGNLLGTPSVPFRHSSHTWCLPTLISFLVQKQTIQKLGSLQYLFNCFRLIYGFIPITLRVL